MNKIVKQRRIWQHKFACSICLFFLIVFAFLSLLFLLHLDDLVDVWDKIMLIVLLIGDILFLITFIVSFKELLKIKKIPEEDTPLLTSSYSEVTLKQSTTFPFEEYKIVAKEREDGKICCKLEIVLDDYDEFLTYFECE